MSCLNSGSCADPEWCEQCGSCEIARQIKVTWKTIRPGDLGVGDARTGVVRINHSNEDVGLYLPTQEASHELGWWHNLYDSKWKDLVEGCPGRTPPTRAELDEIVTKIVELEAAIGPAALVRRSYDRVLADMPDTQSPLEQRCGGCGAAENAHVRYGNRLLCPSRGSPSDFTRQRQPRRPYDSRPILLGVSTGLCGLAAVLVCLGQNIPALFLVMVSLTLSAAVVAYSVWR